MHPSFSSMVLSYTNSHSAFSISVWPQRLQLAAADLLIYRLQQACLQLQRRSQQGIHRTSSYSYAIIF
jgi:hypothetical protein